MSANACENCGSNDTTCTAAARAFRNGASQDPGTIWAVCRTCRSRANDTARNAIKNNQDWTGQTP